MANRSKFKTKISMVSIWQPCKQTNKASKKIQNILTHFNFLSQNSSQSVINLLVFKVSVSVHLMNRIFGPNQIMKKDRTFSIGRVFGRIFGIGLGRYRYFPITRSKCSTYKRTRISLKVEQVFKLSRRSNNNIIYWKTYYRI